MFSVSVWRRSDIVGCAPHSDELLVKHILVPLHHQLVCACDTVEPVDVIELFDDVTAEQVACTARAESPAFDVLWVAPQQVAHGALVRHLLFAVDDAYLVESVDRGREATVYAEGGMVDEGGEGEVVEDLGTVPPHVHAAVLANTLIASRSIQHNTVRHERSLTPTAPLQEAAVCTRLTSS